MTLVHIQPKSIVIDDSFAPPNAAAVAQGLPS